MPVPPIDLKTSTAPPRLTLSEALAAVDELKPLVLASAAETEEQNFHSEELHTAFVENGFYHMMRPRRYGGYEFSVRDFMTVIRELAAADMSTAWCLCLAAFHNMQLASWWPQSVQDEIFTDGHFGAPMTSAPGATLERDTDGWILNGSFGYASGGPYATHFIGHADVLDDEGGRTPSTFVVDRSQWTVRDDWGRTLGLRGSGSHTLDFVQARVPQDWVLVGRTQFEAPNGRNPGAALHGNPMYGAPILGIFGVEIASLAVGGAKGALEEYGSLLGRKTVMHPPFHLRSADARFQNYYAEVATSVQAAEAILDRASDLFAEYAEREANGGAPFTFDEDAAIIRLAVKAHLTAWRALEGIVIRTAGSSAAARGERLERIWRDETMVHGHAVSLRYDELGQAYGAARLDAE
ncbi:acyl-CoA dehydrogenase family protein [Streptomyces sp. NPDC020951]|uniref:acyl-CoA dehydrogenase family protein n=1 Tax=Streptomyces sp. NPDC020951 TaxID=3365104 RepID=UPI0037AC628F